MSRPSFGAGTRGDTQSLAQKSNSAITRSRGLGTWMNSRPFCSQETRIISVFFWRSSSNSNTPRMNSLALFSLFATNTISHRECSKPFGVRCGVWGSSITFPDSTSGMVTGKAGSFRAGLESRSLSWRGLSLPPGRGRDRGRSKRIAGCFSSCEQESGKGEHFGGKCPLRRLEEKIIHFFAIVDDE